MSLSWSSSRRTFASSPAADPAQRAEKMPGAPPSTSTAMPESSASAMRPVCAAAVRALMNAFSAKVTPSSTGSGPSYGSTTACGIRSPMMRWNSRTLCALWRREHELAGSRAGRLGARGERRHLQRA